MALLKFIAFRLLQAIPLLLAISLLSFLLLSLAPGDFLAEQRLNPANSTEMIERLEVDLGFVRLVKDDETGEVTRVKTTWVYQYGTWLKNVVTEFDFGYSFSTRQPVWDVIGARALNTLWLSLAALTFGVLLALPLGMIAAMKQYKWQDHTASFVSFVGLSIPNVFLALLFLMFAAGTGWLPLGGMRSLDFDELSPTGKAFDLLHHVIAPGLVLGTAVMAVYMRQMRGNLLDVMGSDYIRTARAKGLKESKVVVKHGARNAVNPLITMFGFSLSDLLSGSVLVENVLAWPGLGRTVVEALFAKDIYLVMASVMMASAMLFVGNLIADVLLAINDPRIRMRK